MTITPPNLSNVPPFFPRYPLSNITPFTYRDGWTFLELIEALRHWINDVVVADVNKNFEDLVKSFQDAIDQIVADNNATVEEILAAQQEFEDNIQAIVDSINNKSGMIDVQHVVMGADSVVNIDETWPNNLPVFYEFQQDPIYGHHVLIAGEKVSRVPAIAGDPGARTFVLFIPNYDGMFYGYAIDDSNVGGGALSSIRPSESLKILASFPARPDGSLWPQALAWDESVSQWYIGYSGVVAGADTQRIERRTENGGLIDYKDYPASGSTEGFPFWRNVNGELCFFVRETIDPAYSIFNYVTGELTPSLAISGRYKAAVWRDELFTCDASSATSGLGQFNSYDFQGIKAGNPGSIIRTIDLQNRNLFDKLQSYAFSADGRIFCNYGESHGKSQLFVYNQEGSKEYGVEYDMPQIASLINAYIPGTITNAESYNHEAEGSTFYNGKFVSSHVVYDDEADPTTAKCVLIEHESENGTFVNTHEVENYTKNEIELSFTDPASFTYWSEESIPKAYREDTRVTIMADIKTVGTAWVGKTIFTLPAGYLPASTCYFTIPAVATNGTVATIRVRTTGTVDLLATTSGGGDGYFIGLSLTYRVR